MHSILIACLIAASMIALAIAMLFFTGLNSHARRKTGGLLAIAMLCLVMAGCVTSPTGNRTVDPIVLTAVSQEAAAVGASLWLSSHPQDRAQFELARTSLAALVALGNGSPADLQVALSGLPIAQLKGTQGSVIVSGAVVLLDTAGRELAKVDSSKIYDDFVKPVAQGLIAGLDQALSVATPAPAVKPQSGIQGANQYWVMAW